MTERPEIVTDKHLEFLDALRESGQTNMLAAGPFIQEHFTGQNIDMRQARDILMYWLDSFEERHSDDE